MRLLFYSDLHNEFGSFEPPVTDVDVVILAGDTHPGAIGARWALETFGNLPIIYLAGNHEYYGHEMAEVDGEIARLAGRSRLYYLNPGQVILDGVRFVGATLWTDFALFGTDLCPPAMAKAQAAMNDYRRIRLRRSGIVSPLTPADTVALHRYARAFLESSLQTDFDGPTVVVSHHAPSIRSLPDFEQGQLFRAAYCSNLEAMISDHQPALWIHGHTHFASDYHLGATRVICNPRGYVRYDPVPGFVPDFCVTI